MAENKLTMEKLREVFVSLEVFNLRFTPVEKILYGMVGLVLVAFMTGVIAFVIK